jgi:beta-glucosidase
VPEGNSLWFFVYNENQKKTSYYRKKEVRERMRHQELIEKMTLEEKAAFLTGKNEWASRGYAHLGIDSITFADGPSGVRRQCGEGDHLGLNPSLPATCFPSSATMADSWNEKLEEEVGEALGQEAALADVSVLLAPGLNLKRNPLCGRNFEYFSEDPYLSGKMAAAMIRGIQKVGVSACAKHFAVNSQEERRMALNAVLDERTLREMYLTGFEIAVKEGKPGAVMSAYNEVNGTYANENPFLLKQILRKEWGFEGFVVTDWGGGNDFTEGIRNGSNLQMPGCGFDSARELIRALKEGRITEQEIDERVDELLTAALTFPKHSAEEKHKLEGQKESLYQEHHRLAGRAAEENMVLLKNEENILPLKAGTRVALIGDFAFSPRYQGAGSSCVNAILVETAAEEIRKTELVLAGAERGYLRSGKVDKKRETSALKLAGEADVVLFFLGLGEQEETEGTDRKSINIPQNQLSLLHKIARVNPAVVALLSTGSVVGTWWKKDCRAILHTGLSGEAGAGAVMKILTGAVNPSGKLTESWIWSYEDTPSYPCYPARDRTLEYREGIFTGYRYFEKNQIPVSFPFGFGLSYTTFAYRDLQVADKGISLKVKNTGTVDGSEIVQMYVALPESKVSRPEKELKGFVKLHLKAGEEKEVRIPFDDKTFRFFSERSGSWEQEEGTYQILAGSSSQDIRLTGEISLPGVQVKESGVQMTGETLAKACEPETLPGAKEQTDSRKQRRTLDRNDPLSDMRYARNPLARLIAGSLKKKIEKAEKKGKQPDLNTLFQYNMPFRAIAKMTAGMVSMDMVDGIVEAANGHFWKGMRDIAIGFFRNIRENKEDRKRLESEGD